MDNDVQLKENFSTSASNPASANNGEASLPQTKAETAAVSTLILCTSDILVLSLIMSLTPHVAYPSVFNCWFGWTLRYSWAWWWHGGRWWGSGRCLIGMGAKECPLEGKEGARKWSILLYHTGNMSCTILGPPAQPKTLQNPRSMNRVVSDDGGVPVPVQRPSRGMYLYIACWLAIVACWLLPLSHHYG